MSDIALNKAAQFRQKTQSTRAIYLQNTPIAIFKEIIRYIEGQADNGKNIYSCKYTIPSEHRDKEIIAIIQKMLEEEGFTIVYRAGQIEVSWK